MATLEEVLAWKQVVGPDFERRLIDEGKPWIMDRTVGLFRRATAGDPRSPKGGDPSPWGSGVLLAIENKRFVVSAAHVLCVVLDPDIELLLAPGGIGDSQMLYLRKIRVVATEDQDSADF